MSTATVAITPESNSGAHFLQDETHFHKCGRGDLAERVKLQAVWIAKLTRSQALGFPKLAFVYWSADSVAHTSERLSHPSALHWMLNGNEEEQRAVATILVATVQWAQEELHCPAMPCSSDATRLVVRQTAERIQQWRLKPMYLDWLNQDRVQIGGRTVRGVTRAMRAISDVVSSGEFDSSSLSTIHGDIHMGNIITNLQRWWLIDPRGTFAGGNIRFDPYYEWGKLLHDCHGLYGLICSGNLSVLLSTSNVAAFNSPSESSLDAYRHLLERLMTVLDGLSPAYGENSLHRRKLLLYEGLILLGIIPFHDEDPKKALTIACVGLLLIDQFLDGDAESISLNWLS